MPATHHKPAFMPEVTYKPKTDVHSPALGNSDAPLWVEEAISQFMFMISSRYSDSGDVVREDLRILAVQHHTDSSGHRLEYHSGICVGTVLVGSTGELLNIGVFDHAPDGVPTGELTARLLAPIWA